MKRILCTLLILALLTAGCAEHPLATVGPTVPSTPSVTEAVETLPPRTVPPTTLPVVSDEVLYLRDNLPTMDGSTSLIPLEAGIRAALFGKSMEEATRDVSHTTSWSSFYNLTDGTVDLVFSVPLSAEQKVTAEQQGITLETVPIAMEGFVFVVNTENPVDKLTQQQLRDIYSGKITNWKEVGGLDEEIIAYQRNRDSGSQNFMIEFMGDIPLMDAPTEKRPASMSGLMDVIAVNDNSRAAIGYSVYAYAADMYGNGNEIKFIQVDGVAPCKQSFADGSYPLMGYNYAVFHADQPEDGSVRRLVDWILSDEGQHAVARAGYVTVRDIGFDYAEAVFEKYEGIGLGLPAGTVPSSEYVIQGTAYTEDGQPYPADRLPPLVTTLADGTRSYRIDCLADKLLQQEINDWIDQQMIWVAEEKSELIAQLEIFNQGNTNYHLYEYGLLWDYSQPEDMDAACIITVKNGYLSVAVTLCYREMVMMGYNRYFRTETATWDLIEGRRLTPEELFCEGVDIDDVLNDLIQVKSQQRETDFVDLPELLKDFVQLSPTGWHLTHDAIYFDTGGPVFAQGFKFDLDDLPDGTLVTEQLRDFAHCIDSENVQVFRTFRISDRDLYYAYNSDELVSCGFLKEDTHPNAAKINSEVMAYLNEYYTEDAIRGYYEDMGYVTDGLLSLYMMDWNVYNLGRKYLLFNGYAPEMYLYDTKTYHQYPAPAFLLYDIHTGSPMELDDLLLDGWEEAAVCTQDVPFLISEADCINIFFDNGQEFSVILSDGNVERAFRIPAEFIRY